MITLKEIAEASGVSPMTVSYVLNRPERVREETRRRVLETMRRLDYRPRAAARALRSGKTRMIACALALAPGEDIFYHDYGVIGGLAERLDADGYHLLVKVSREPEHLANQLDLDGTTFDAVILWGREQETAPVAERLARRQIPFVVKGRHEDAHPDWPQVDFDHEALMAQAFGWLEQRGHKRVAYLGFALQDMFVACLVRGAQQAIRSLGLDDAPHLLSDAGGGAAGAERQMTEWLGLPPDQRPTALVIGAHDAAWHGVERALFRQGRRIGEGAEGFPVTGISSRELALLQGQSVSLQNLGVNTLVGPVADLLRDVLAGTVQDTVRRVGDSLQPLLAGR